MCKMDKRELFDILFENTEEIQKKPLKGFTGGCLQAGKREGGGREQFLLEALQGHLISLSGLSFHAIH